MASPLSGNLDPDHKVQEEGDEKNSHKIHGDQRDQQGAEREPGAGRGWDVGSGTTLQVTSRHMDLTLGSQDGEPCRQREDTIGRASREEELIRLEKVRKAVGRRWVRAECLGATGNHAVLGCF